MKDKLEDLHNLTVAIFYLLLDENDPLGPNDVKNRLNLNSRSKAYYHLNKLYELDFVVKTDDNRYLVNEDIDTSKLLGNYIKILSTWLPKSLVLGIISIIGSIVNLILFISDQSFILSLNFVLLLVIGMYLLLDGYRMVGEFKNTLNHK